MTPMKIKKLSLLLLATTIMPHMHAQDINQDYTKALISGLGVIGSGIAFPYLIRKRVVHEGNPQLIGMGAALSGIGGIIGVPVCGKAAPNIVNPTNATIALATGGLVYFGMNAVTNRQNSNSKMKSYWQTIEPAYKYGLSYGAVQLLLLPVESQFCSLAARSALFLGTSIGVTVAYHHFINGIKSLEPIKKHYLLFTDESKTRDSIQKDFLEELNTDSAIIDTQVYLHNAPTAKEIESESDLERTYTYNIVITAHPTTSPFILTTPLIYAIGAGGLFGVGMNVMADIAQSQQWSAKDLGLLSLAMYAVVSNTDPVLKLTNANSKLIDTFQDYVKPTCTTLIASTALVALFKKNIQKN